MGTETMEKTFTLPNKTITVRYIRRKKGMATDVPDNHAISGGMLNEAFKKYSVPIKRNKALHNVLTNEEKEFLEGPEGLNRDLSVYKSRDFWTSRYVILRKGDNVLDLSDPIDYIDYKILLGNPDWISPSIKLQHTKATYDFVIVDEEEEREIEKSSFNYKKKAFKLYSLIEDSPEVLRGILKIINKKPISETSKLSWLQTEVEKIIDTKAKQFVELVEDANYEYKILLSQAEDAGVVIRQNQMYSTAEGIELAEAGEIPSFDTAVKYLANPKNIELVEMIRAKMDKIKK